MHIVIATQNSGKLHEIQRVLEDLPIRISSMLDFPQCPISQEPYDSYLQNARDKARQVARHTKTWALADDSGLEVPSLDGQPGVHSARYAGVSATDQDNIQKLLDNLASIPSERRQAVFRCCMVLAHPEGQEIIAEGELWGNITDVPRGQWGFGYDPVFQLDEMKKTLAELDFETKNSLSHRFIALQKLKTKIGQLL